MDSHLPPIPSIWLSVVPSGEELHQMAALLVTEQAPSAAAIDFMKWAEGSSSGSPDSNPRKRRNPSRRSRSSSSNTSRAGESIREAIIFILSRFYRNVLMLEKEEFPQIDAVSIPTGSRSCIPVTPECLARMAVPLHSAKLIGVITGKNSRWRYLRQIMERCGLLSAGSSPVPLDSGNPSITEIPRGYSAGRYSQHYFLGSRILELSLDGSGGWLDFGTVPAPCPECTKRYWKFRRKQDQNTIKNAARVAPEYLRQLKQLSRFSVDWEKASGAPQTALNVLRALDIRTTADHPKNTPCNAKIAHGRFYTPFHTLKREYRGCVCVDGSPLRELFDVTACFVTLSVILAILSQQGQEDNRGTEKREGRAFLETYLYFRRIDIYQAIAEGSRGQDGTEAAEGKENSNLPGITRKEVKESMMKYLFSNRADRKHMCESECSVVGMIDRWFTRNIPWFPRFLNQYINERRIRSGASAAASGVRYRYVSRLSLDCQRLESLLMFRYVLPELRNHFPEVSAWVSLHDGIFVTAADYEKLKSITDDPEEQTREIFWNAVYALLDHPQKAMEQLEGWGEWTAES